MAAKLIYIPASSVLSQRLTVLTVLSQDTGIWHLGAESLGVHRTSPVFSTMTTPTAVTESHRAL